MENTLKFAENCDKNDVLSKYRTQFNLPDKNGRQALYFTGNSLGLQPKKAVNYINEELTEWANRGVDGHFEGKRPWFSYHDQLKTLAANVVGAKPIEVTHMNSLTTNLHLLMVSFYRPTKQKYKILCEGKAFPSDQYALETQVNFHGFNADDALVELHPREGEEHIRHEDVLLAIEKHKDSLALVMIGGVNYYTGQVFKMKEITQAAQKHGIVVGFDLAHAAGNVHLKLHDWGVDFAVWCSYKYLNASPGGVSGIFVHEKHANNTKLNRFAGWWGNRPDERFLMKKGFKPAPGADGWMTSNAPILTMAPLLASLEMFNEVGMEKLNEKSTQLTQFLNDVVVDVSNKTKGVNFEIITPTGEERGCQLSILMHGKGKEVFDYLEHNGAITDWREPNVIRVAPVPLYNSYKDVFEFGELLAKACN